MAYSTRKYTSMAKYTTFWLFLEIYVSRFCGRGTMTFRRDIWGFGGPGAEFAYQVFLAKYDDACAAIRPGL